MYKQKYLKYKKKYLDKKREVILDIINQYKLQTGGGDRAEILLRLITCPITLEIMLDIDHKVTLFMHVEKMELLPRHIIQKPIDIILRTTWKPPFYIRGLAKFFNFLYRRKK